MLEHSKGLPIGHARCYQSPLGRISCTKKEMASGAPNTAERMREAGISEAQIATVVWNNPVRFYAQSGALEESVQDTLSIDQRALFEGNSVLRGQAPRTDSE